MIPPARLWALVMALCLVCTAPLCLGVEVLAPAPIQVGPPAAPIIAITPLSVPILRVAPSAPIGMQVQLMLDPEITADIERMKVTASRAGPDARQITPKDREAAAEAAWWLGLIYLHGAGTSLDPVQAQQWFSKAQRLGHPMAAAGLALCAIEGCSGAPSMAEARTWIAELRRTSTPRALYLEWLVESHTAPLTLKTPTEPGTSMLVELPARELLIRAATLDDPQARIELGLDFAAAQKWQAALEQFRAAAPRSGTADANAASVRDILSLKKAAPVATARWHATLLAAKRQHRSASGPANYQEALRLYQQAEAEGSVEATRMLALIFSRPAATGDIDIAWMRQLAYIDLATSTPTLGSPTSVRLLKRDPTPLFDLMPRIWRERFAGATPR
jgi:TPR repeat protein